MKLRLTRALVCQHMLRRSLTAITILAVIAGLIAFYLLVGRASSRGMPNARAISTMTATPTQQRPIWNNEVGGTPSAKAIPTTTATPTQRGPIWNDEFDGPRGAPPDPSKWTPKIGQEGWGNGQMDYDTNNQNAYQDGQGNLVLEAHQEEPAGSQCWYGSCRYTSARITTHGHFSFTYGRLEARIKLPFGQGIWPAFWLLGSNCDIVVSWPACGKYR